MCTVYATIGNSDDKLGQALWHRFTSEFIETIRIQSDEIHGVWWSAPDTPWQNCCVGFSIRDRMTPDDESGEAAVSEREEDRAEVRLKILRESLTKLREFYGQEAVAWVRGYPPEMI